MYLAKDTAIRIIGARGAVSRMYLRRYNFNGLIFPFWSNSLSKFNETSIPLSARNVSTANPPLLNNTVPMKLFM